MSSIAPRFRAGGKPKKRGPHNALTAEQKAALQVRKKQYKKERDATMSPDDLAKRQAAKDQKRNNDKVHAAGGRGVEIMSTQAESPIGILDGLTVPGATTVLPVVALVQDRTVSYLAMGIVLRAIKKGLLTSQTGTAVPYYVFRYLIDAFTTCMRGGTSIITEAPMWYWEIFHALKPKQVNFKTGAVSFSWQFENTGQTDGQIFTLGNGPTAYSVFWGTSGTGFGNEVNGFPILGATLPYTPADGLSVIAKLWNFASGREEVLIPDPGASCSMYRDTSAFSVVYPEIGESYFSVGAFRTTIYNERHIDSPILAKFAMYQPQGSQYYRGWQKSALGAGSASSIGPMWLDAGDLSLARTKFAPTVKFYNFDEFFETLSLTVASAMENLAAAGQSVPICPLTPQEVQILLRQAMIPFFNNDVFQDLRYEAAENVVMLPFVVGPNGSSTGTVDMMVPTFLAENIRCCKLFSAQISKKFKNSVLTWYPVLGRPSPSEYPQLGNYTFGIGTEVYTNLGGEVPINIIDVSAIVGQTTAYLDLTRTQIQQLKESWNTWITQISSCLSPLTTLTGEKGIRALNCNLLSLYCEKLEPNPPVEAQNVIEKGKKDKNKPGPVGTSLGRLRATAQVAPSGGNSYFMQVGERRVTSVEVVKPPAWAFSSKWILPVQFSDNTIGQASAQALQAFLVEPNNIPKSSAGGLGTPQNTAAVVPDAYSRHLSSAQIDTKAFATLVNNEYIEDLKSVGREGRGGFFTGMIADLVGAAAPEFAATAKIIGSALPW